MTGAPNTCIDGLAKTYDSGVSALKDVLLTVALGENLALPGLTARARRR